MQSMQVPFFAIARYFSDDKADCFGLVVSRVVAEVRMRWVRCFKDAKANIVNFAQVIAFVRLVDGY